MTFDQLEVGRLYYARYKSNGEPVIVVFGEFPIWHYRAGEKYLSTFEGCTTPLDTLTDIRPVLTWEEWEKMMDIQEKAQAVMEWYDRDGSVGGAVDPMDQLRAALAAVGE